MTRLGHQIEMSQLAKVYRLPLVQWWWRGVAAVCRRPAFLSWIFKNCVVLYPTSSIVVKRNNSIISSSWVVDSLQSWSLFSLAPWTILPSGVKSTRAWSWRCAGQVSSGCLLGLLWIGQLPRCMYSRSLPDYLVQQEWRSIQTHPSQRQKNPNRLDSAAKLAENCIRIINSTAVFENWSDCRIFVGQLRQPRSLYPWS